MGRFKNPVCLQGEETCRKVVAILRQCREAYEDGIDWVNWPRSDRSDAYDGALPCEIWWADADAYTLHGLIKRLAVTQTNNRTKIPAYKFLLEQCEIALNYEVMSTTVFINAVAWSRAPLRKKSEVIDLLRKVEKDLLPVAQQESKQFA